VRDLSDCAKYLFAAAIKAIMGVLDDKAQMVSVQASAKRKGVRNGRFSAPAMRNHLRHPINTV
jgi:hypothetical protein